MEEPPIPEIPAANQQPIESQTQSQNTPNEPKKPKSKKLLLISGFVVLFLIIVGIVIYFSGILTTETKTETETKTATKSAAVAVYNPNPVDAGVTWLAVEKSLPNLGLITPSITHVDNTPMTKADVSYYLVGNDTGKDIVVATVNYDYGGSAIYQFLKIDDSHYEYLSKYSEKVKTSEWDSKVTAINDKTYNTLTKQEKIEVNNIDLVSESELFSWMSNLKAKTSNSVSKITYTNFANTPYGEIFLESEDSGGGVTNQAFVLRLNNGTATYYYLKDPNSFIKSDGVPAITWDDGGKNSTDYRKNGVISCGTPHGTNIIASSNMVDLIATGKSTTGVVIYEFSNPNNAIVQSFYNAYKSSYDTGVVAIDVYLKSRPLLVYKDSLNRLQLLNGGKYVSSAECGKPVVYLYPTKTQKVSVQVDAKITVSEPDYGNGWNVTAYPNGTIVNRDGKVYESLFWEGTGKEYPRITHGEVVAKADIEATLKRNLEEQGLTKNEANDFMEFWLPKMPQSAYTRLTWFNTWQMNRLAPLQINPEPDTLIRVFLDFAPLNTPVVLQPQKLFKIPRLGFTVVEWGGLLRK